MSWKGVFHEFVSLSPNSALSYAVFRLEINKNSAAAKIRAVLS